MNENKERVHSEDEELDDNEDTLKDKYLTFRLGDEDYGIDISYVTEIIGLQKITEVPDMPQFVRGVINLRGRVIPVIDIRSRFQMDERKYDDRTCVIVVNINNTDVGLVVDIVNEVISIPENNISPPPSVHKGSASRFVRAMGRVNDAIKILLDMDKLLFDEEITQLDATSSHGKQM